jgi:hypothetical protein
VYNIITKEGLMFIKAEHNDFKVKLRVKNFTEKEGEILQEAVNLMAHALGSRDFKEYCLNYKYKVKMYRWTLSGRETWYEEFKGFYNVGTLTQYQIWVMLMKGKEVLSTVGEDNEADMWLEIDRSYRPNVIGYTYPSSRIQYIYARIFEEFGMEDVAANLAHEWVHKMGFSHKKVKKSRKRRTCPYAVGDYVRQFVKFKKLIRS